MKIVLEKQNLEFNDIKLALCELAFCHYPVKVVVDGEALFFEAFSEIERYLKSL